MPSTFIWVFLVWILCLKTFGLWLCTVITLSSLFASFGFITMMIYAGQSIRYAPTAVHPKKLQSVSYAGIPNVVALVKQPIKLLKSDQRLTGSTKIDEPLQEIICYVIRDYIHTWYKDVSSDESFFIHLKDLLKNVVNNISSSAKEVDWVSFFTKHLVDDFASHLRLYRQSEKAFKKCQKLKSEKYKSLEDAFFDLELSMEKDICRDIVCTSHTEELRYLSRLSDMLLYLLLPSEDFKNTLFRYFLRDLLSTTILHPTVSLLADPDYINQNLIWACKDYILSSKAFLSVIRRSDSIEELLAVVEIAKHELKVHKSKDTHDKDEMRQYIKSINYVYDVANQRHQKLLKLHSEGETDSVDFSVDMDWKAWVGSEVDEKLITLPFDIVLNNNIGLHYFSEFMTSINAEGYVFFFHNIEGYRATAESILSEDPSPTGAKLDDKIEKLREFAMQIYDTYLGENAAVRVNLDELMLSKLHSRITTERLTESFFDDVQAKIYKQMEEEYYTKSFKESKYYVKLLAELDLLPDVSNKDDESMSSMKLELEESEKIGCMTSEDSLVITELLGSEVPSSEFCFPDSPVLDSCEECKSDGLINAEIYNTGVTHHAGKTFAVYAIAVSHHKAEGQEERWFVVRRYREFHVFHKNVSEKFPLLSSFDFPSKKAFNNLSRHLMEKRRCLLNEYLQFLLSAESLSKCDGLQKMIYTFLEPRICDKEKKSLVRTVGNIVDPIRTSVKTVGSVMKLVPSTIFHLKDGLVKVLNKTSNPRTRDSCCLEMDKVSAELDFDAEDIPLRIVLLLLDEVFDLKSKDLWFRRRIMVLLRQIIKTTQGDAINKKLLGYVKGLMSASQLAEGLKIFSQVFWPKGIPAESQEVRDDNTKFRTRLAAKALLICCIPDELKHVIGKETSFKGAMIIYSTFQQCSLNRRLMYVLLESFLMALFPQNNIADMVHKFHSESPRTAPLVLAKDHFGDSTSIENILTAETKVAPISPFSPSRGRSTKVSMKNEERKRHSSLSCLGRQDISPMCSPKHMRKRKKSLETAVFYTDVNKYDIESPTR